MAMKPMGIGKLLLLRLPKDPEDVMTVLMDSVHCVDDYVDSYVEQSQALDYSRSISLNPSTGSKLIFKAALLVQTALQH